MLFRPATWIIQLGLPWAVLADSGWRLEGDPIMWEVEGEVGEKNRLDISSVAGFPDGGGLLAGDEMREINLIRIDRETKRLVVGETVVLLPGKGTELFAKPETATAETHLLDLGPGFGVRSMTALKQGYLILAGASGTVQVSGFSLHLWEGPGGGVRKIADLPDLEGKAEGMMVLEETEEFVELLIVRDGSENGGPYSVMLLKP